MRFPVQFEQVMPGAHFAREREILAQGRCITVRDETEKHGCSLVEGASRAVARMNQREIAQAQTVALNNAMRMVDDFSLLRAAVHSLTEAAVAKQPHERSVLGEGAFIPSHVLSSV